jgi:putative addiction module killer protein
VIDVRQTERYAKWLAALRDVQARARIEVRIRRLTMGHLGHVKVVGGGVSELKIDYGPGYRVYFARIGSEVVLLLCGGDKRRQDRDIAEAQSLLAQWKE